MALGKLLHILMPVMVLLAGTGGLGGYSYNAEGAGTVLDTDRDEINLGQDLTIILSEPDANFDSRSIDRIPLSVLLISTDKFDEAPLDVVLKVIAERAASQGRSAVTTNHASLRETGFNTGIFEVTLESINDLLVDRDKDIRITYMDIMASGGSGVRVEKVVHVARASIALKFSKNKYTPFDTAEVVLVAQMFNVNRNKIDTLNTPTGGKVVVTTPAGGIHYPPMFETGVNTGTFMGRMILTPDPVYREGDLVVKSGDRIRVTVTIIPGFELNDSALVSNNLGSIAFDRPSYNSGEMVRVVVIDPDENKDPDAPDSIQIKVWSSMDTDGITLALQEVAAAPGMFEGEFALATAPVANVTLALRVSDSDVIFARYYDRTVPSVPSSAGKDLFESAKVGLPVDADVLLSEPLLLDQDGVQLRSLQAGELMVIQSPITNLGAEKRGFVYITHVKDGDGFTAQLAFVKGTLEPFQSLKVARSWIPHLHGNYIIEVLVWASLAEPSVLSPVKKVTVSVME